MGDERACREPIENVPRHEIDKLILHDGVVHTLDDHDSTAAAIGFSGGHVTSVGPLTTVREATPDAEERSLAGGHLYPGFIDTHHHLCFAATYANFPEVRCPPHRSIDSILATLRACAERTPVGQWIVLVGYDENRLAERRKPTRSDLDRVTTEHPVLLVHFSYHEGVLNSPGLVRADLEGSERDPGGGWMGRTRGGALDGRAFERCFGQAESIARREIIATDRESWFAKAGSYQGRVLAAGITHVCDAAVPPSMEELYREWKARGELHLGVTMMPLVENIFAEPWARLDGTPTGWRDGRLSVGPLKLFTDGGIACAMCLSLRDAILQLGAMLYRSLRQASADPWRFARQQPARFGAGGSLHTGLLYYEQSELERIVADACERGLGVGIHAGGNEAIAQALAALGTRYRAKLPPRVDHFFFLEDETLRRAADLGAHVVVQPYQLFDTGDLVRDTGLPRGIRYQAHREMLDAGLTLAGSSDAPVFSFDVLAGIEVAVRRHTAGGGALSPEQALTVAEVLRLYTRGAAATLGMNGEIGQLKPGSRADAVLLSEEIERTPAERLSEVGIRATFAGRTLFAR
jgi:predicted amidohydrolase YtcJ